MGSGDKPKIVHATTVAVGGKAALILGPSGSGKSALALHLITLGAKLVSDDRTELMRSGSDIIAAAPAAISGLIEARGVGLIRMDVAGPTPVTLVIDLSRTEPERLPHGHTHDLLGITLPCLWGVSERHFAPAVLLYLKGGVVPSA